MRFDPANPSGKFNPRIRVHSRLLAQAMFRALDANEPGAANTIHEWLLPHSPAGCPICQGRSAPQSGQRTR